MQQLPKHDIVLLGAGHTNAHIIRMWRMRPIADARLTCVSNTGVATYSGMLPGVLAGDYEPEGFQIDLVRLCAASGVRLIVDEVTGLDPDRQRLSFVDRPPLRYDYLSIGIGSMPFIPTGCEALSLSIKPMPTFLKRLDQRLDELCVEVSGRPIELAISGAGAGGVEVALCLGGHLRRRAPTTEFRLTLVDRGEEILSGAPTRARRLAMRQLSSRGVEVLLEREIVRTHNDRTISFRNGDQRAADLVIWATSAEGPPLLRRLGMPLDDRGFLLTRDTMQSQASDRVYAVGDSGSNPDAPHPKAGVYAVRQGPVLWQNLQRQLNGLPPKRWRPQSSFLSLLNTGDRRAILAYRGFCIHSRWCWHLKDWIDRRFMTKHQDYAPPSMARPAAPPDDDAMHCGGCGCKLPGDILSRVLRKLDTPATPQVAVGLENFGDVAVLRPTDGRFIAVSTDFFSAFMDDPYLVGRVAALNSLSDLYAKRAKPTAALAIATIPHGDRQQQEEYLTQLLAGATRELRETGAALVGGHTTVGPQATIGFTVIGETEPHPFEGEDRLASGDLLVLTKPLGVGALLAAHNQARCHHAWMDAVQSSMLDSNRAASEAAGKLGARAMTDVTGFGLCGHLLSLLSGTGLSAEVSLDRIPLLPGAGQLLSEGVQSTLAPGNRSAESSVDCPATALDDPRYLSLFDPQTSGGLLIAVPEEKEEAIARSGGSWACIGRVVESTHGESRIHVRESAS